MEHFLHFKVLLSTSWGWGLLVSGPSEMPMILCLLKRKCTKKKEFQHREPNAARWRVALGLQGGFPRLWALEPSCPVDCQWVGSGGVERLNFKIYFNFT